MTTGKLWRERFRVPSYESDPRGIASLPAIFRFLQEAAGCHARALGLSVEHLNEDRKTWVLSRLRVCINRYPALREELDVETWPSRRTAGARAWRDFRLWSAAGDVLGEATSFWLILDLGARRPVRLPRAVLDLPLADRDPLLAEDGEPLAAPSSPGPSKQFEVRWHDLDLNRHANNTRYVEWLLESAPADILQNFRAVEFEISFQGEAVQGELIGSRTGLIEVGDRPLCLHQLTDSRGSSLALARSRWSR